MRFGSTTSVLLFAILSSAGCFGGHGRCDDCVDGGRSDGARPDAARFDAARPDSGRHCLPHAPREHRATAQACDRVRRMGNSPDGTAVPAECRTDADCTTGINGRCNGNGHDGWRCTYDACFTDSDCTGTSVCECEGEFRSDANVCLSGDCRVDADCATGFCSPTLGTCGNYTGTVGWYCHTCEDECVDDSDCDIDGGFGPGYCAFNPTLGHWACAQTHCAG